MSGALALSWCRAPAMAIAIVTTLWKQPQQPQPASHDDIVDFVVARELGEKDGPPTTLHISFTVSRIKLRACLLSIEWMTVRR